MNNYIRQATFKMLDDAKVKIEKNESGEYVSEYFSIECNQTGYYNIFIKENFKFKIIVTIATDIYLIAKTDKKEVTTPEVFVFDLLAGKMKIEKIPNPKSNELLYVLQHCKQCESCKKCTLDPCGYKHILKFSTKRLDEIERIIKEYNELMGRKLKNEQ